MIPVIKGKIICPIVGDILCTEEGCVLFDEEKGGCQYVEFRRERERGGGEGGVHASVK